jgi:hypothetical protein
LPCPANQSSELLEIQCLPFLSLSRQLEAHSAGWMCVCAVMKSNENVPFFFLHHT